MSSLQYFHTMIRISDPERSIRFFNLLGLEKISTLESPEGRFTLYFMAVPGQEGCAQIELTHNWDESEYTAGRNFGHLAYYVENIYETCQRFIDAGVVINRPPRDGQMAFVRTPDNISIELLQREPLPLSEPWVSMPNQGSW